MKKYVFRTGVLIAMIGILIAMICVPFLLDACLKYPPGKDTVLSVGNGRFQLHHGFGFSGEEGAVDYVMGKRYFLDDAETQYIDSDVRKYYDDRRRKKLYLICGGGYIIVDYEAGSYEKYHGIEDCMQTDQTIFEDESRFTALGQR